jgi:uncharacterized protein (DUF608 family)
VGPSDNAPGYYTAESPADIWKAFTVAAAAAAATEGSADDGTSPLPADAAASPPDSDGHGHGAASSSVTLQPGETRSVSVVLAWYLPHALYTGEPLGVWYSNNQRYNSSADVAEYVVSNLDEQLSDAVAWNRLIVNTSLPPWLSALLVNTPATEMESGFWTADGRYRQYDNM